MTSGDQYSAGVRRLLGGACAGARPTDRTQFATIREQAHYPIYEEHKHTYFVPSCLETFFYFPSGLFSVKIVSVLYRHSFLLSLLTLLDRPEARHSAGTDQWE